MTDFKAGVFEDCNVAYNKDTKDWIAIVDSLLPRVERMLGFYSQYEVQLLELFFDLQLLQQVEGHFDHGVGYSRDRVFSDEEGNHI